jgi:hypothetical protein
MFENVNTIFVVGTEIDHKSHLTQFVACFPLLNYGFLLLDELSLKPGLL